MSATLPATQFEALRDHLLAHSVKRGDFVLKSGRRSSWFIDSKQTVCRPEAMVLVADGILSILPDDVTAIGGLTMGADPVAFITAGVAAGRGRMLKAFSVRKEAKAHGGGGRIAGALDPGGVIFAHCPNVSQVARFCDGLREHGGFGLIQTMEVLQRGWTIRGRSMRPDHRMVAHTGFLTFARRLAGPEVFETENF